MGFTHSVHFLLQILILSHLRTRDGTLSDLHSLGRPTLRISIFSQELRQLPSFQGGKLTDTFVCPISESVREDAEQEIDLTPEQREEESFQSWQPSVPALEILPCL